MDAERWKRVKALLAAALDRRDDERAAYLAENCKDDSLRADVAALLEAYQASDVLSSLAADDREYELEPGAEVGPYVIAQPVGRGGGGEVYRARDARLQRDVALKLLAIATSAQEKARRMREARAAAQLNHRGIAAIYDFLEHGERPCIVMEYVAGPSLAERLRSQPPDVHTVVGLGIEMADAVAHAHAAGIVHCDLKPGNMRFAADGSLKILDFGLARRAAGVMDHGGNAVSGLTASSLNGLALGTPGYMAPEQLLGAAIDCRTDVYCLGVVLYEMAAGRRPFGGDPPGGEGNEGKVDMATAVAVLSSPLPDLPREVPRRLRGIIVKCLNREADRRYATAADLRDALGALATPAWRRTFAGWRT